MYGLEGVSQDQEFVFLNYHVGFCGGMPCKGSIQWCLRIDRFMLYVVQSVSVIVR